MNDTSWRKKSYGRISGGSLESWLQQFRDVWAMREDFLTIKNDAELWVDSFEKILAIPNWVVLYEQDFLQLACGLVEQSGFADGFVEAAKGGGDALLRFVEDVSGRVPPDPSKLAAALPPAMAMLGNLEGIAVYSRSINDMVKAAQAGEVEALSQAVSIDAYVLCFPFFLTGIRVDQLSRQDGFTNELFRTIRGPHLRRYDYVTLRWAEYLLRDQGAFTSCTREEIYELLVDHLKLYDPAGIAKDPKSALFAMFKKWQKQAGIQNPRFGFSGKQKT